LFLAKLFSVYLYKNSQEDGFHQSASIANKYKNSANTSPTQKTKNQVRMKVGVVSRLQSSWL
jgi:hypothetical protein